MSIAWQIEQTDLTGRDWTWKCSLFRFSGHLGPWPAFNVKNKLTRHMYSSVIIEVYSSNIANTYLSLRWIPRVRARARTITPAITWSRSWNPKGQFDFKIVAQIWKRRFQQYLFAKFLPTLHYISQQDMNWGCPCRLWRQEDRPDYPGSWLRSAPRTILLQKILMW